MIFFRQLFTSKDDKADEMAVLTVLGVLTFIGLAVVEVVVKGHAFDPQAYGIGLAATLGAAGVGMGFKNSQEKS